MFIEKLTKKDIEFIFKNTIKKLESQDRGHLFENAKINRYKKVILVTFNTAYDEHDLHISDFNASFTYGGVGSDKRVTKAFLKCMYQIFGDKYVTAYKEHIKQEHNDKIARFMDEEYNNYTKKMEEINEITK